VRAGAGHPDDRSLRNRARWGLAHRLGHETVGEGVEDDRTLELLRSLGVDYAQGFYIGPPAPVPG
jgi:EAL domain-containing protein (putative c-di-GMP-specific phosphodiesterase class I)